MWQGKGGLRALFFLTSLRSSHGKCLSIIMPSSRNTEGISGILSHPEIMCVPIKDPGQQSGFRDDGLYEVFKDAVLSLKRKTPGHLMMPGAMQPDFKSDLY